MSEVPARYVFWGWAAVPLALLAINLFWPRRRSLKAVGLVLLIALGWLHPISGLNPLDRSINLAESVLTKQQEGTTEQIISNLRVGQTVAHQTMVDVLVAADSDDIVCRNTGGHPSANSAAPDARGDFWHPFRVRMNWFGWLPEVCAALRPPAAFCQPFGFRRQRRPVAKGDATPAALVSRTWQYAAKLGLDKGQFVQGSSKDSSVSFVRTVEGIAFWEDLEGFFVQYGPQGEIRFLTLNWPKLERVAQEHVIGPDEITRCIRAFKTPIPPENNETDYLGRVKAFAGVRTLTITNITPYYTEGKYGQESRDSEAEKFVEPIAALDAVADWGSSNAPVRLFAPLIASDADRLLAQVQGRASIPKAALEILEKGEEFTLLSLNPNVTAKSTNRFCGYAVLGKLQIREQSKRQAVLDALYGGISATGPIAECFNPRHGIHAKMGNQSEDFLICCECGQVYLYGASQGSLAIGETPAASFNQILSAAHVPLSK